MACVSMIVCVHVIVCEFVANGCTYMFDSLGSEGVKLTHLRCDFFASRVPQKCAILGVRRGRDATRVR